MELYLDLVWSYGSLVVAYLCGHFHQCGFCTDKNNIRHITLPAVLEPPPNGSNSYPTGLVFEDRFELKNKADPTIDFSIYF